MSEQAGISELQKTFYERENERGILQNALSHYGLSEKARIESLDEVKRNEEGKVITMSGHIHLDKGEQIKVGDSSIIFSEETDLPVSLNSQNKLELGGSSVSTSVVIDHEGGTSKALITSLHLEEDKPRGLMKRHNPRRKAELYTNIEGYGNKELGAFSIDSEGVVMQRIGPESYQGERTTFEKITEQIDFYEKPQGSSRMNVSPFRQVSDYIGRNLDNSHKNVPSTEGQVPQGADFKLPAIGTKEARVIVKNVGTLRFQNEASLDNSNSKNKVTLTVDSPMDLELGDTDNPDISKSCDSIMYNFTVGKDEKLELTQVEIRAGKYLLAIKPTSYGDSEISIKEKISRNQPPKQIGYYSSSMQESPAEWLQKYLK